ncbi:hypothetical protein SAMN03080615_01618 [Amphritea atlantica]|uniref:Uncharacterized protein n=1 Tax=Amphritea atlantica TaxID=355243 RepID=A0A1H9GD48_9GAMM|nr:hypothetical protein [Amphritea atlantica]SEQ48075.1 hypothetical protein SAMN03080615_01618 [Amphritea atlantica]
MDMPSPCPNCGNIVEFHDMVNHPNEFRTLVCEECHDQIQEENNRGDMVDKFGNRITWKADPDDGLIESSVNSEEIATWCYEDEAEATFLSFMEIWNKAQERAQVAHESI